MAKIQIRRNTTSETWGNQTLAEGELAFDFDNTILKIGKRSGGTWAQGIRLNSAGVTYKTTFNGQNYGDTNSGENLGSFYAPTSGGTSADLLVSSGSGAPTWKSVANAIGNYVSISSSGVIQVGDNSITPLTSNSTLSAAKISGILPSSCIIDGGSASGN